MSTRVFRHFIIFFLLGVIALGFLYSMQTGQRAPKAISYSEFQALIRQDRIAEVVFEEENKLIGKYKETAGAEAAEAKPKEFFTYFPPDASAEVVKFLNDYPDVKQISKPVNKTEWWLYVMNILPYLLLFGFFILIMRQAQSSGGQAFSFGRSKHKLVSENRVKVTFDDVAGVTEAKEELSEVVDYLKFPKKYQSLGARIPKGVLLLGAPGTGKTLLGRAVAGEAGVPFYYISGSDFVEMFVGVGASRVRDLFDQAKKTAPCIVFVDEIDAVGRQRGAGLGGGHDEREQTLNQLLVEMDGFEPNTNVIVLAATNRPDVLDPALLRPGRFDRQVVVDKPDIAGRLAILKVHSRGKPLGSDVDLHVIARQTPGFSGADLENLLNEAALQAARANRDKISMADCEEAIDRVMMGPERKSRVIPEREREVTAYHEAGHAMVARGLTHADPVRKVTVLPRGMALGLTSLVPEEDRYSYTAEEILARIAVFMGGRAAEELIFREITTGASNDIERATELARDMVCRFGMSDVLGPVCYGRKTAHVFLGRDIQEQRNFSEDVAKKIDNEVRHVIESQYQRALEMLRHQKDKLEELARELIQSEVLEEEDLRRILGPSEREKGWDGDGVSKGNGTPTAGAKEASPQDQEACVE